MNSTINFLAWLIIQAALYLALAPLVQGFIKKSKAYFQGRRGPDLWQPYRDLGKLWGKETIYARPASWITRVAPGILFATTLTAAILLPTLSPLSAQALNFGDVLTMLYLLAAGGFFLALAGLDAGSSFGGMGSSRELMVASLLEPGTLLALSVVVLAAGSSSLGAIINSSLIPTRLFSPAHLLATVAVFLVAITETGRIPVDNPDTHLELTMLHEGMTLEYTGRPLALIAWATQVRQLLILTLLTSAYFPFGIATSLRPGALALAAGVYLGKLVILGLGLALVENLYAKMRIFRVPSFLWAVSFLGVLALVSRYLFELR